MSTENYYEKRKLQQTCFDDNTLSNGANGKQAKEAENTNRKELFTSETHLQPTLKAWRCGGIIERLTNPQQKAFYKKQMYKTLFVCPHGAKPMLHAVLLLRTEKFLRLRLPDPQEKDQKSSCQSEYNIKKNTFQKIACNVKALRCWGIH